MIRNQTDELVIRPRVPTHWRVVGAAAALLCVAGLAYAGYFIGSLEGLEELRRSDEQVQRLTGELARLRERHEEVVATTAQVQRQLQIDKVAYEELSAQLYRANEDLAELGNELRFYRSIISPADGAAGLRIHNFELRPADSAHLWRYKLVLIQALNHGKEIRGRVSIKIEGAQDGASATHTRPEPGAGAIEAKFKYFQVFEGEIRLPEGFEAEAVTVSVQGKKKKDPGVAQRYAWSDLLVDE